MKSKIKKYFYRTKWVDIMLKNSGLGKGLDSLIPDISSDVPDEEPLSLEDLLKKDNDEDDIEDIVDSDEIVETLDTIEDNSEDSEDIDNSNESNELINESKESEVIDELDESNDSNAIEDNVDSVINKDIGRDNDIDNKDNDNDEDEVSDIADENKDTLDSTVENINNVKDIVEDTVEKVDPDDDLGSVELEEDNNAVESEISIDDDLIEEDSSKKLSEEKVEVSKDNDSNSIDDNISDDKKSLENSDKIMTENITVSSEEESNKINKESIKNIQDNKEEVKNIEAKNKENDLDGLLSEREEKNLCQVIEIVETNPRITLWSAKAAAVLRYLRKTEPEFSISKEASKLIEDALAEKYPEIWTLFDHL